MSQLAEVTGIDRRTVKSRLAQIKPFRKEGKAIIYDTHQVLAILLGFDQNGSQEIDPRKALLDAELQTEQARAEKLRLEVDKMKGEVVAIDDVCRTVGKEYTYVRAALLALPNKAAKPMAMEDDPTVCQSLLKKEVDEILNHLQADVNLNIEPEEIDEAYFPEDDNN
jgi:hypothetical protein